uniref:Uncharacterized protein n=1 Tax=Zea mays TaxID=4577 RepID=C0PP72_MAIZE|nr:unknown [Zea mays]
MALLRLLAISLLFAVATPVRDIAHDACSSEVKDFQHLNNSSGLHLTLHHPQSPCSPAPLPADLPFSAVLAHDGARIASLAARLAKTPSSRPTLLDESRAGSSSSSPDDESLASVPLGPGTSVGVLHPGHVLPGPGGAAARARGHHGLRRRRGAQAGRQEPAGGRGQRHHVPGLRARPERRHHREHAAADVQRRLRRQEQQDRVRRRRLQLRSDTYIHAHAQTDSVTKTKTSSACMHLPSGFV